MIQTRRTGFTLIEMLTVLAITAVLLTIITVPIFQSFNLTRAAEAFADAQDQGRRLTEKIAREISESQTVRGNSLLVQTTLNGNPVSLPAHTLVVQVPGKNGVTTDVALPWTKLDIVLPAQQGPRGPNGEFVDPNTGKIDPTLKAPKGQAQLPVSPSAVYVRYSVALRDPTLPYHDPYTGKLMALTAGRDNLVVLYRSEAIASIMTGGGPVVNTALFDIDPNTQLPIFDDPRFLVLDRDNAGNILHDAHNVRAFHWLGPLASAQISSWENTVNPADAVMHNPSNFAHTTVLTEVSRYDMIQPQLTGPTGVAVYDGNVPRLTPLVMFRPTVVSNDPAAGQEAVRQGEETDNAQAIAPDVFVTQYGLWNNAVIRNYPGGYTQGGAYDVGYIGRGNAPGFSIYAYPGTGDEFLTGDELFDTYTYDNATAMNLPYPFTQAALAANSRGGWLNSSGDKAQFTPYHILGNLGKIVASFDIAEVGVNAVPAVQNVDPEDSSPTRPNLPTLFTPDPPMSPINDNGIGAVWSGTGYDINRAFNRAWNLYPDLQPNIKRFIDVRVIPNEDGTFGPLYPLPLPGAVTDFLQKMPDGSLRNRCSIVPGTETVYGPDQNPGPNYGHKVRYTRTTHDPGPNQYRFNPVDQQEPTILVGGNPQVSSQAYQQMLGLTNAEMGTFDPTMPYDPTNFVSATIQPRYKAGYFEFNSDPNLPLPNGYVVNGALVEVPFKIDFRFQFTGALPNSAVPLGSGASDVFAVDYDSRQLMQVLLTIRNYPQSNLPNPQSITLKATATIRNYAR